MLYPVNSLTHAETLLMACSRTFTIPQAALKEELPGNNILSFFLTLQCNDMYACCTGPGVLGSYLGKLWLDEFPSSRVVGQTNSETNHDRCCLDQLSHDTPKRLQGPSDQNTVLQISARQL